MQSKILRKFKRVAAAALAGAMIFGSMTVMAEGEGIQTTEETTVVAGEETEGMEEAEAAEEVELLKLLSGTWTGERDIVIEVNGNTDSIFPGTLKYYKAGEELGVIESPTTESKVDSEGKGTITVNSDALKGVGVDWTGVDELELTVVFYTKTRAGSADSIRIPVEFAATEPEEPKKEPVFETSMTSWDGMEEIRFAFSGKPGGEIEESAFTYNIYTKSGTEPKKGIYAWKEYKYNVNTSDGNYGTIHFCETLESICKKQGIGVAEVEKVEFVLEFQYDDGSKKVKSATLPVDLSEIDWEKGEYYASDGTTYYLIDNLFNIKLGNGVDSYEAIPFVNGDINGEAVEGVKMVFKDKMEYYFVRPNQQIEYLFAIEGDYLDDNTPFLKEGYELQVKTVSGDGEAEIRSNSGIFRSVYLSASEPSKFEVSVVKKDTSKPEESTQIVDKTSGVSMDLPADAPEGLSLQVNEDNGAEEKEAVSKLVQVEGDKIKTFDLSLLKDGVVWEYKGQFQSKVTLPVPEGWNLDLLGLYYYDEATGKATEIPFTVDKENKTITFETDHFSRYVLVQKVAAPATSEKTDAADADKNTSPKTGDTANGTLYMMMLLAAGAVIAVSVERKRR